MPMAHSNLLKSLSCTGPIITVCTSVRFRLQNLNLQAHIGIEASDNSHAEANSNQLGSATVGVSIIVEPISWVGHLTK